MLEYNVRFGDPETQVVVPRIDDDVTALLAEAAAGRLRSEPKVGDGAAVCVVLAAEGYPGTPKRGDVIDGLEAAGALPGVTVVHAGTTLDEQGRSRTAGGRVLGVVGRGDDLAEARRRAYAGVGAVAWPGAQYRTDIAAAAAEATSEVTGVLSATGRRSDDRRSDDRRPDDRRSDDRRSDDRRPDEPERSTR